MPAAGRAEGGFDAVFSGEIQWCGNSSIGNVEFENTLFRRTILQPAGSTWVAPCGSAGAWGERVRGVAVAARGRAAKPAFVVAPLEVEARITVVLVA